MKFNTYSAALAYVTDGLGNQAFVAYALDQNQEDLRSIHNECIGEVDQNEQDWLHEVYNQSGETVVFDATISVECGDAQLGFILVWYNSEGYTERCYAIRYPY